MSTYIEILRAHQQGKLMGSEPPRQDSIAPLPETAPTDASTGTPPEEPRAGAPDSDNAANESPEAMLQEEAGAPLPIAGSTPLNPEGDDDAALDSLLQEESEGPPLDFSEDDDAIFAQMLQDEPEAPPEDSGKQASADLLADEVPDEAQAQNPQQAPGEVPAQDVVHAWLSGCVMLLVRLYEDAAHDTPSDIAPLLRHLDRFGAKIYEDPEELSALELDIANRIESIRQSHADCGDLVQKAVMMMLYGFKVCVQMRMEPAEITRYVAAAILHNIGMAQIFVDTRQKEGKLTNAERTLIRHVSEKSVDYLKRCGISDRVILLSAQQAQERHDGSGPHGLAGADIALSARIVGLLSMFEALVHVRSYRERLLPRDAIRELVNGQKNRFDPIILKNLIESVSLYPVGTYVQLNSGDIGQVIRIQPRLPLRPKVVLTMDRHGNRIQPREVDLQKQPNLMVQRCMYREGLVPMKPEAGET